MVIQKVKGLYKSLHIGVRIVVQMTMPNGCSISLRGCTRTREDGMHYVMAVITVVIKII